MSTGNNNNNNRRSRVTRRRTVNEESEQSQIHRERRPRRIGAVTLAENVGTREQLSSMTDDRRLNQFIPDRLRECSFFNQILQSPCHVRLTDRRYNLVSQRSYQTQYVGHKQGTLSFSILHSILAQMVRNSKQPRGACIGGDAVIRILGNPESSRNRTQKVISDLSKIRLISRKRKKCWDSSLVYVPVHIDWMDENIAQALRRSESSISQICSNCEAHASAILIDTVRKTVQVYDSNGSGASWYAIIANWVNDQFQRDKTLRDYQMLPEAALPQIGIQTNTRLQMCAYFAALYVAIRIHCSEFSAQEANNLLLEIGVRNMYDLLSRFHCFLIDYAYQNGVLEAADKLPQLYGKVFFVLGNAEYFDIHEEDANQYDQELRTVEKVAYNDVVTAYRILQNLWNELPHEG